MPYIHTYNHVFAEYSIIAGIIFALVMAIMVTALIWRRAGSGRTPNPNSEHELWEGLWVAAVAVVVGFLIWQSQVANATEKIQPPVKDALKVQVVGYQWCWRFGYPAQHVTVIATCAGGADLPTLVLPTGRRVDLQITSQDVVHEFWMPHFKMKMEAFPDHTNLIRITFDKTGEWLGHCSEYCGLYHSDMLFHLKVVTPAAFSRWLAGQHRTSSSLAVA